MDSIRIEVFDLSDSANAGFATARDHLGACGPWPLIPEHKGSRPKQAVSLQQQHGLDQIGVVDQQT
jgi:hypothetical protein